MLSHVLTRVATQLWQYLCVSLCTLSLCRQIFADQQPHLCPAAFLILLSSSMVKIMYELERQELIKHTHTKHSETYAHKIFAVITYQHS